MASLFDDVSMFFYITFSNIDFQYFADENDVRTQLTKPLTLMTVAIDLHVFTIRKSMSVHDAPPLPILLFALSFDLFSRRSVLCFDVDSHNLSKSMC